MKLLIPIYFIILLTFISFCNISNDTKAIITSKSGLNIRSEPKITSKIVGYIPYNTRIDILDENGPEVVLYNIKSKWYKIKFNTKIGWAFGGFIKFEKDFTNIYKLIPIKSEHVSAACNKYYISHLNQEYIVDENGYFYKAKTNQKIKLTDEACIEKVFYGNYKNDIIIVCQLFGHDAGWSNVYRININEKPAIVSDHVFGGFNLSNSIIENNNIYLATHGFIGKYDLDTGKFIWNNSNLYIDKFNYFSNIIIEKDKVIFIEDTLGLGKNRKIEVEKINGKVKIIE